LLLTLGLTKASIHTLVKPKENVNTNLTFSYCSSIMVSMNKLDNKKREQVIAALVEGNSIRATVRMTGVAKNTIVKLLADVGEACLEYQDKAFRNLTCKRIQCDEIWSFVGAKAKNVPAERQGEFGFGDLWTWVSMDADTKLVPCWHVGRRDAKAAYDFITDLASRLKNRVQLSTDGHKPYLEAVEAAFGCDVDYAMLVKIYGKPQEEIRYSPADCLAAEKRIISGEPNKVHISTSYIERQNLTMRMSMRRFTRLTNGFSKKIENHIHAISLHYMYYNFVRVHKTLRCTPAMEAGVTKRLWEISDIVALLDKK
jgi:IS1 family transposase